MSSSSSSSSSSPSSEDGDANIVGGAEAALRASCVAVDRAQRALVAHITELENKVGKLHGTLLSYDDVEKRKKEAFLTSIQEFEACRERLATSTELRQQVVKCLSLRDWDGANQGLDRMASACAREEKKVVSRLRLSPKADGDVRTEFVSLMEDMHAQCWCALLEARRRRRDAQEGVEKVLARREKMHTLINQTNDLIGRLRAYLNPVSVRDMRRQSPKRVLPKDLPKASRALIQKLERTRTARDQAWLHYEAYSNSVVKKRHKF